MNHNESPLLGDESERYSIRSQRTFDVNSNVKNKRFYEDYQGGIQSITGEKIYYMGIIDIFTGFGCMKKAENILRSIQHSNSRDISCVHPQFYGERFYNFMEEVFK